MRIYLSKNPAKFHPDPIWNEGALCFFEEGRVNNKKTSDDDDDVISSWSKKT